MIISRPASTYDQAKELLASHRRMTVGAAIERAGPIGDAVAELAFAGKAEWEYSEVRERIEELRTFTMPVGQWLGRYHSSKVTP